MSEPILQQSVHTAGHAMLDASTNTREHMHMAKAATVQTTQCKQGRGGTCSRHPAQEERSADLRAAFLGSPKST